MNAAMILGLELDDAEQEALRDAAFLRLVRLANEDWASRPIDDAALPAHIKGTEQHARAQEMAAAALRSAECGAITGAKLDAHGAYFAELLHEAEPSIVGDAIHGALCRQCEDSEASERLLAANRTLLQRVREAVA
jgi:hypothetical protein